MKQIIWKRALAFLIDSLIVSLLIIISQFFIEHQTFEKEINLLNDQLIREEITFNYYYQEVTEIYYQSFAQNMPNNILSIVFVVLIFMFMPLFLNKTIGMHVTSIKYQEKIKLWQLFIRTAVIQGLVYSIIGVILIYFIKDQAYFITMGILGFFQLTILLASAFMVLLKEDNRGLQDILSKSLIVLEEEENA